MKKKFKCFIKYAIKTAVAFKQVGCRILERGWAFHLPLLRRERCIALPSALLKELIDEMRGVECKLSKERFMSNSLIIFFSSRLHMAIDPPSMLLWETWKKTLWVSPTFVFISWEFLLLVLGAGVAGLTSSVSPPVLSSLLMGCHDSGGHNSNCSMCWAGFLHWVSGHCQAVPHSPAPLFSGPCH